MNISLTTMACVAGLMNMPAPPTAPTVVEVETVSIMRDICRHPRSLGCYIHPPGVVVVARGMKSLVPLGHELAHHVTHQLGIKRDWLTHQAVHFAGEHFMSFCGHTLEKKS